jgi:hypothetical protein
MSSLKFSACDYILQMTPLWLYLWFLADMNYKLLDTNYDKNYLFRIVWYFAIVNDSEVLVQNGVSLNFRNEFK